MSPSGAGGKCKRIAEGPATTTIRSSVKWFTIMCTGIGSESIKEWSTAAYDSRISQIRETCPLGENVLWNETTTHSCSWSSSNSRVHSIDSHTKNAGWSSVHVRCIDTWHSEGRVGVQQRWLCGPSVCAKLGAWANGDQLQWCVQCTYIVHCDSASILMSKTDGEYDFDCEQR